MTSSHSDMTVPQRADTALLRVNLLPVVWKTSLVARSLKNKVKDKQEKQNIYVEKENTIKRLTHENMFFLVLKFAIISLVLILPCVH